jgi:hypothetical protein
MSKKNGVILEYDLGEIISEIFNLIFLAQHSHEMENHASHKALKI